MSSNGTADASSLSVPAHAKIGLGAILIPVLLSTVVTLTAVGGGVAWLLKSGKLGAGAGTASAAAVPPATIVIAPPPTHVLTLEPMIVNLADEGGRSYLRAAVSLRIRDEKTGGKEEEKKYAKAADGAAAALRDTTLAVLSSQTSGSLLQPDSRETLKKKLDEQYKLHNPESRVLEIYFTEFLVQRG